MSQSSLGIPPHHGELHQPNSELIHADDDVQHLLDVLGDPSCRAILDVTSDDTLSAREIAERCELPLSTTYRKLDALTETGLIEEQVRLQCTGRHPSEYFRSVKDVIFSVGDNGKMDLWLSRRGCPNRELSGETEGRAWN